MPNRINSFFIFFVTLAIFVVASCGNKSLGEQRAKLVIQSVNNGITGPELQQMINKDGEELKGQDLIDYYDILQQHGIF